MHTPPPTPKKIPRFWGIHGLQEEKPKSLGLRKVVSWSSYTGRARFLWKVIWAKLPQASWARRPVSQMLTKAACLSFSTSTPGDEAGTWACRVRLTAAVWAQWFHWRTILQLPSLGCKKSWRETTQQWNHQWGAGYNGTLVGYSSWSHGSRNTEPISLPQPSPTQVQPRAACTVHKLVLIFSSKPKLRINKKKPTMFPGEEFFQLSPHV